MQVSGVERNYIGGRNEVLLEVLALLLPMRDHIPSPKGPRPRGAPKRRLNLEKLEKLEKVRAPPPPAVQRQLTGSQGSQSQQYESMEEPPRKRRTLIGRLFGTIGGKSSAKRDKADNYKGFMLNSDEEEDFAFKRKNSNNLELGFEESHSFRKEMKHKPRPPSMSLHPKKRKASTVNESKSLEEEEETDREEKDADDDEDLQPRPPPPRPPGFLRTSLRVVTTAMHIARPPSIDYREYEAVKKAREKIAQGEEEEEDLSGLSFKEKAIYKAGKFKSKLTKKLDEEFVAQRILFCFLAVSLLWITSLGFCVVLIDAGLERTTYEAVRDSLVRAVETANLEGEGYESCVLSEATRCRRQYENDNTAEKARVKSIVDPNTAILNAMTVVRDSCAGNNTEATANIRKLISVDNLDIDTPPENVGSLECSNISKLVLADLIASQAFDVAEATSRAATSAFDGVQAQLLARANYDLNFLGEKTGVSDFADLEQLLVDPKALFQNISDQVTGVLACVSDVRATSSGGAPPECTPPYAARVATQFQDYRNRYNETVEAANDFREYAESAINQAIGIAQYLNDACPVCVAFFDTFTQPDPFDALSLLTSILCPNCDLSQLLEEGIANTEAEIRRQIEVLVNQTSDDIKFAEEELTALTNSYKQAQQDYVDSIFGDYNPPEVDNNGTDSEFARSAEALSDKMADTLDFVPEERPDPDNVGEYVQQTEESAATLLERVDPRQYDLFIYAGDLFGKFEAGFGTIADLIITYDLVYRVIQSMILVRKYWTVSNINTPPADIRPDSVKGTEYSPKQNPVQLLARILTHPIVYLIVFTTGVVLGSLALYTAYSPFYSAYIDGCVEAEFFEIPDKRNGTMLYRNGLTVASTYAFSFGDRKIKEEVDSINVNRTLECRKQYDDGFVRQTSMRYVLDVAISDQVSLNERYNKLDDCLDFVFMDDADQLSNQVLNLSLAEVYGREECKNPINQTLIETSVGQALDISDDMIYNCSAISQCTVTKTCPGPSLDLIRDSTFKAACITEWYLHGLVIYFVAAIVVFTVLNVSRYYLMLGLVAVWWQNLSNTYSYWAACDAEGKMIKPKGVVVERKELSDVIAAALKKSLRRFQATGFVYVAVAILLNVPWIAGLIVLSQNFALDI